MTRPLELVNTVLLTVIAVLLAILVLTPPSSSPAAAPDAQPLSLPTVDCQIAQLFEEGEQLKCIPVRILDAP